MGFCYGLELVSTQIINGVMRVVTTFCSVFQWAIVLPLEITVASFTIYFWTSDVHVAVWITMFLLVIIFVNVFGVLGYGEEEFWSSALKLSAIVIFMIIGLVLVCGGGPSNGIYDKYWGARKCFFSWVPRISLSDILQDSGMTLAPSRMGSRVSARSSSPPPLHSPEPNSSVWLQLSLGHH